jgi:hypothetical protein
MCDAKQKHLPLVRQNHSKDNRIVDPQVRKEEWKTLQTIVAQKELCLLASRAKMALILRNSFWQKDMRCTELSDAHRLLTLHVLTTFIVIVTR